MTPDTIHAIGDEIVHLFTAGWWLPVGLGVFLLAWRWLGRPAKGKG